MAKTQTDGGKVAKVTKAEKAAKSAAPAGAVAGPVGPNPKARLQTIYRETIVPDLMAKFGFTSVMQVPRLQKITLNMGVSEAVSDKKDRKSVV